MIQLGQSDLRAVILEFLEYYLADFQKAEEDEEDLDFVIDDLMKDYNLKLIFGDLEKISLIGDFVEDWNLNLDDLREDPKNIPM